MYVFSAVETCLGLLHYFIGFNVRCCKKMIYLCKEVQVFASIGNYLTIFFQFTFKIGKLCLIHFKLLHIALLFPL